MNARDERNILEWTVHHLNLGFDHIYIFDHISDVPISQVLKNLEPALVTVERREIIVNKEKFIEEAYHLALNLKYEWMLYLDADEFLVLNHTSNVIEFLTPYLEFDQVGLNWLMFGSNGLEDVLEPHQTLLESYTKCSFGVQQYLKSFLNLKMEKKITTFFPHMYFVDDFSKSVHVSFGSFNVPEPYSYPTEESYSSISAYIAHYTTQSYSTFLRRKINIPRDDIPGQYRELPSKEKFHSDFNDVENLEVFLKYNEVNKKSINRYQTTQLVQTAQHSILLSFKTELDDKYKDACERWGNIHEHVPTLMKYAKKCQIVAEFNHGGAESSYGLLKGLVGSSEVSKVFIGKTNHDLSLLVSNVGVKYASFTEENSTKVDLKKFGGVDLLFINTWHIYGHLKRELSTHCDQVRKYIIMHNTTVDEKDGESIRCGMDIEEQMISSGYDEIEIRCGLGLAIKGFLKTHEDWYLVEKFTNNHGLVVLGRHHDEVVESGKNALGFVLTRHVTSETTNLYWKECISQIRIFYPTNIIMIVDDNSDLEYLNQDGVCLDNCIIIKGEYPGCGELLAYYYFHKHRLFEKTIVIHDSVFIQAKLEVESVDDAKILWDFPGYSICEYDIETMIKQLNRSEESLECFRSREYSGCFGLMSVMTYTFLEKLNLEFNLFNVLDMMKSRENRQTLERVFGVAIKVALGSSCSSSLFGSIFDHPQCFSYSWEQYQLDKVAKSNKVFKVFTGR